MCPAGDDEYLPRNADWSSTPGWVMYSLEKSGSGESHGLEVGHRQGRLFCDMASPFSPPAPKVPLESKHKHTLFPKLIVQWGLPIFLPLMDLCTRPRVWDCRSVFAQGVCLWATLNYHHDFKNRMNILLAWLNSWGMFSDSPFFVCLIIF